MIDRDSTRSETTFAQVYEAFRQAQAAREPFEASYKIADFIINLRFAGTALAAQMMPALAHLRTHPTVYPDLTICFWDSVSTGVELPHLSRTQAASESSSYDHVADDGGRIHMIYQTYDGVVDILRLLDREMNTAIYWIEDAARLPFGENTFAVRPLLHWWLRDKPFQLMHAGAVGMESGGVLITGKRGAGKSTTTLACLNSELLYLGDDYVLAELRSEPATAHSISNSAKLVPDNLHRFPALQSAISNPEKLGPEKALIYLQDYAPEKLISRFPIRAILQPRVTHQRDTRLVATSPVNSLMALAPTTVFHMQSTSQESLSKMSQLVRSVPNYIIEVGTDLGQIPDVISRLLQEN